VRAFLCDTNIWVALALTDHTYHLLVRSWLETVTEAASLLFCRSTQQSFLRLVCNPSVMGLYGSARLTNEQAWAAYDALSVDVRVAFQHEEPLGIEPYWRQNTNRRTVSPKLWMDAYLAAFAVAGDYRLVTTDKDFRQFGGLDLLLLGDTARS
jgi:toxin-antitoxin system PIN domain toxin